MSENEDWAQDILAALNKLANSPSLTWEQVSTYAALPAASTCGGSTWLVLQGTGVWPANKPSGWYYSDGVNWSYLGTYNPVVTGGNVVVTNFPAVQPVSFPGGVSVANFPSVQPVSDNGGSLTVDGTVSVNNFPSTQLVSGIFWQSIQPVSGTVSVANFPSSQPVSGPLTDVQLRASAVSVIGTFYQAIQPVSGTFWQAIQPISGTVSVSNFPATQPVSGTVTATGPLTDTQLRSSPVPVSATFFQATQPISAVALPLPSGASTEATLALIKAKTDNLDVVLSSRTKPADTQTIAGSVSVSNFPATQLVSGTFWQVTQPVSGTFWQAIQPVSASALPLPSGASTEATLALIKAKTDNIDVLLSTRTKPADTQVISGSVSVNNFPATQPISAASLPLPSGAATEVTLAAAKTDLDKFTFTATRLLVDGSGVTQPVSGPLTDVQLRASAVPVSAPVLTKGTQAANGFSVQQLKDAGRTYVSFTATAIAGVIAEALVSFNQNKQGTNTAAVTSYVIPNGKTLRISSISISLKSGAAAIAFARLSLRHNTAGATIATSPVAYLCPEINTNSAVLGTGASITIPIPDGIEFFGNGTQTIGVSHLDQATTNILNITVHGFEY